MSLLRKGQEFSSWEEFTAVLKEYQDKNFVQFVVATSSTVENKNAKIEVANKLRSPQEQETLFEPNLKYQNVKLTCKFGGRCRIKSGRGIRIEQSTFKAGCGASIHLIAKSKSKLRIVDLCEKHDEHEITETNYRLLPEQRQLSQKGLKDAKLLLKGGVKPSVVRSLLREMKEGYITARDIANLKAKWKQEEHGSLTEEQKLVKVLGDLLEKDPGCTIKHGKTEDGELKFLFVQTSQMKKNVQRYGKVLLMDHTYKINKHRMPVTVFMVKDGHGNGRSAGYAFVADETLITVSEVLQAFRDGVSEQVARQVKTIVIDKDPSEIGAAKAIFPDAQVQLCKFHTSRTIKERCAKESSEVKEIVNRLKETVSEQEFQELSVRLKEFASEKFYSYFETNWLKCPEAWANKDKQFSANHGNFTTNIVECHNSKIKMMLNSNTSLSEALHKLLELVQNKEEDVVFATAMENLKRTYLTTDSSPEAEQILKDLTRYAAKLQVYEISTVPSTEEMQYYQSTSDNCTCTHHWSYELPCRHMYQRRRESDLEVYSFCEIEEMWHKKKDYESDSPSVGSVAIRIVPSSEPKTGNQRLQVAAPLCNQAAHLMAESGRKQFRLRRKAIETIIKIWASGKEVAVLPIIDASTENQLESSVSNAEESEDEILMEVRKEKDQTVASTAIIESRGPVIPTGEQSDVAAIEIQNAETIVDINVKDRSEILNNSQVHLFSSDDDSDGDVSGNTVQVTALVHVASQHSSDTTAEKRTQPERNRTEELSLSGETRHDLFAIQLPAGADIQILNGNIARNDTETGDVTQGLSDDLKKSFLEEDDSDMNLSALADFMESEQENSEIQSVANSSQPVSCNAGSPPPTENGPHCRCGIPAVRRTFKSNPNRSFWGCSNYFSANNCNFRRFAKSIKTNEMLQDALAGIQIPGVVKTKGRPSGHGKTYQRTYKTVKDNKLVKIPAGGQVTLFQMEQVKKKERELRGEAIPDRDVTMNGDGTFKVTSQSTGVHYTVTEVSCTCPDPVSPCKHMFKILKMKGGQKENGSVASVGEDPCHICKLGEPSHSCLKCKRKVHAINPCSVAPPGEDEGYGKGRICSACNVVQHPKKVPKRKLDEDFDAIDPDDPDIIPRSQTTRSGRVVPVKKPYTPSK